MILAIIVSILSGLSIVIARTMNAQLSEHSSVFTGTFLNFATGLLGSFIILIGSIAVGATTFSSAETNILLYTGGLIGVLVIALSNITVAKLSSLTSTLLLFAGQVFTGIILDALLTGKFSKGILIGSVIVSAGLVLNILSDNKADSSANK